MSAAFKENQFVKATWKGKGKEYDCLIDTVNGDGTYAVMYSDGDYDPKVPQSNILAQPDDAVHPGSFTCAGKEEDKVLGTKAEPCGCVNKAFAKACSKCKERNPRYPNRAAFGGGFSFFRRPKPPKIDQATLPDWNTYYDQVIKPNKKQLLVKRHPTLMAGLNFKLDKEMNKKIVVWNGDITALEADSIVNAANDGLWAGGGICGVIHSAAGSALEDECRQMNGCPTGQTVITNGYELYAKKVLHSVGPTDGNHDKLRSCYETCLDVAEKNGLKHVVFCCLATGIFGFPNGPAAIIALTAVRQWLEKHPNSQIERLIFCTFAREDKVLYDIVTPIVFPVEQDNVQVESKDDSKASDDKDKTPKYNVNDIVMCLDTENVWLRAQIQNIDERGAFIHYVNYSTKWDEWIKFESGRIAPFTRRDVFKLEPLFAEGKGFEMA